MMKITRTSTFSRIEHTMDLDVTQEQLDSYASGEVLLQNAFPQLNAAEREFIKTGITAEEWDKIFGKAEDAEDAEDVAEEDQIGPPMWAGE